MAEVVRVSIEVGAPPADVFPFFTDAKLMMEWMADSAELDAHPGGALRLHVNGSTIVGTFLEVDPPRLIRFSWGFEGVDALPPGASDVEVRLTPTARGTLVELRHDGLGGPEATQHRSGWRRFLLRLRRRSERPLADR